MLLTHVRAGSPLLRGAQRRVARIAEASTGKSGATDVRELGILGRAQRRGHERLVDSVISICASYRLQSRGISNRAIRQGTLDACTGGASTYGSCGDQLNHY